MNAIDLLRKDHEAVRGLFQALRAAPKDSVDERTRLLEQIARELQVHSAIEEEIFYPAYKQVVGEGDKEALYFEALEEHRAVGDMILPDLLATDPGTDRFNGRAKVLRELVEHHAREEETEMFPVAEKLLGAELLEQLGQAMAVRKSELTDLALEALATRSALGGAAAATASAAQNNGASFR
jgi:hemerythrin superfamily protein